MISSVPLYAPPSGLLPTTSYLPAMSGVACLRFVLCCVAAPLVALLPFFGGSVLLVVEELAVPLQPMAKAKSNAKPRVAWDPVCSFIVVSLWISEIGW